jgi:hypothetical protein
MEQQLTEGQLIAIEVRVMNEYPITKREYEGCLVEMIENMNKRAILRKRLIREVKEDINAHLN